MQSCSPWITRFFGGPTFMDYVGSRSRLQINITMNTCMYLLFFRPTFCFYTATWIICSSNVFSFYTLAKAWCKKTHFSEDENHIPSLIKWDYTFALILYMIKKMIHLESVPICRWTYSLKFWRVQAVCSSSHVTWGAQDSRTAWLMCSSQTFPPFPLYLWCVIKNFKKSEQFLLLQTVIF